MEQPWRVGLALAVIAALAGGIVWGSLDGGDGGSIAAPVTTTAVAVAAAPDTAAAAPVPTTGGVQSARTTSPSPPEEAVFDATVRALAAWGEYAVTGDLSLVEGTFVAAGPQLEQLRGEAPARLADPLGPPPYVFEIRDPVVTLKDAGEAVVAAQVVVTRPREPSQAYEWRIHLHRIGGTWQLWTVEPAE